MERIDIINKVYIMWLVCSLSAATLAGSVQDRPVHNAADIYQKVFDRYPSKEVKEVEQKIDEALIDNASKKEEFAEFSKKAKDLKANSAYQLKEKVEAYAKGETPLSPEIETYIRQQQAVLDLIRKASTIKTCSWPDVPNRAVIKTIPAIDKITDRNKKLRGIYFLALADARLEADQGQYKKGLLKAVSTFPIFYHAGNSSLLEHLMCLAMETKGLNCLRDILGRMPVDMAVLKELETQLNKENRQFPSFCESVLGEKAFFMACTSKEDVATMLKSSFSDEPNSLPQISDDYLQKSIDYNNLYFDRVYNVLDLPYIKAFSKIEQINQQAAKDASIALNPETGKIRPENILKTNALLTILDYSNLSKFYIIHIKTNNQLHATLAAVKIYQDFAQTGKLPQNLPSDCPVDLFSDKPYEYKISEDGFILLSAGQDIGSNKTLEYHFALHVNSDKKSDK